MPAWIGRLHGPSRQGVDERVPGRSLLPGTEEAEPELRVPGDPCAAVLGALPDVAGAGDQVATQLELAPSATLR